MATGSSASAGSQGSRRHFLKTTGAAAASLPFLGRAAHAAGQDRLRVGLVGCGGRGTGAAVQAVRADEGAVLWSMGDLFQDRLALSAERIEPAIPATQFDVAAERRHVGFDAFRKVCDEVDVVLLATPPVFRPEHLAYAIEAGCHVFCEKPVAVDAPGIRSVLASARKAKEKGLSLASGFCWRARDSKRAVYGQIHDGRIGDVRMIYATYLTGGVWHKERREGWTDLEHQLRNWYYYTPFSGDFLVEQAVHSVDKILWAKQDAPPARATATGGRQVRTDPKYGNIYDHFSVVYEWEDGAMGLMQCRQMPGCHSENLDRVLGADGTAWIDGWSDRMVIRGERPWEYDGGSNDMYQAEHDALFADVRAGGGGLNQGEAMAHSTLAAIMGRMSAYTGQEVTWDMALHSEQDLTPGAWAFGPGIDVEVAMPGETKFV